MLQDIFGESEREWGTVYKTVQKVIKRYMQKTNKNINDVARELGTTKGYLYKQMDPNCDSHPLSIDRLLMITYITKDNEILKTIAEEFDMVLVEKQKIRCNIGDIDETADKANIKSGDLFKCVKMSISDGIIDKKEKRAILKEINEAERINALLKEIIKEV